MTTWEKRFSASSFYLLFAYRSRYSNKNRIIIATRKREQVRRKTRKKYWNPVFPMGQIISNRVIKNLIYSEGVAIYNKQQQLGKINTNHKILFILREHNMKNTRRRARKARKEVQVVYSDDLVSNKYKKKLIKCLMLLLN